MSIQDEASKIDIVAGLERALDRTFDRLRQNARRQWERQFPRGEPSDACVTVRINTPPARKSVAVRSAGILTPPKAHDRPKLRPRLA